VPVTVALNCWVWPGCKDALEGETVTLTGGTIVTVAAATKLGSATLVAVTVTGFVLGTVAGAKYRPVEAIVPIVVLPPGMPLTAKVTDVLARPVMVTTNCAPRLVCTVVAVGLMAIVMEGRIVTLAEADLVVSARLVAVTVTGFGEGTEVGAVYTPEVEMVPTAEFPPTMPLTLHVTAVLVVPVTVAVNCN
jgi:hypothetical protein